MPVAMRVDARPPFPCAVVPGRGENAPQEIAKHRSLKRRGIFMKLIEADMLKPVLESKIIGFEP